MRFSIIIPVYNRPHEVEELLHSLTVQERKDFEVLIIEDGSSVRCDEVVDRFRDKLSIQYFFKRNTGPGPSRNFGFEKARGQYLVVFDSDCIIPPHYFVAVERAFQAEQVDAWGGPDKAHNDFTLLQRAMGYTMSSFLTTGGIRGGKKRVGWFQPRSFNMGISRTVYEATGGFKFNRLAEDIEFSIRMKKAGFAVKLIPDAYVYHKRRTNLSQFFNQVSNFGRGRIMVGIAHPEEVKFTHWFPTVFTAGLFSIMVLAPFFPSLAGLIAAMYGLYFLLLFLHSFRTNRNLAVAALSVPSALCQLMGYGTGFFTEWVKTYISRK